MLILSVHPEMDMLAYILGIPRTVRIYGMLKTGMNMFNGGAPYRSYEANLYSTNVFGQTPYESYHDYYNSFTQRSRNLFTSVVFEAILPTFWRTVFSHVLPPQYTNVTFPYYTNLTPVHGVEGMLAPYAVPPTVKYVYPFSKNDPKLKETIPADMQAFLDKHDKSMVIAFGTFLAPTNNTMKDIVDFVKSEKDYAILWALRQRWKYPQEIFEGLDKLDHVYIVDYIP
jgi:hypothetical protein